MTTNFLKVKHCLYKAHVGEKQYILKQICPIASIVLQIVSIIVLVTCDYFEDVEILAVCLQGYNKLALFSETYRCCFIISFSTSASGKRVDPDMLGSSVNVFVVSIILEVL